MLADKDLQLLTAFVDGEMTRRQRKAVLRLLHKSSEARTVLRDLQENSHKLKQMPYRKLEASLSDSVLTSIAERGLKPLPAPTVTLKRRWPAWTRWAAAAAILAALVGGYLALVNREPNQNPIVENPPKKIEPAPVPWETRLAFGDLKQAPRKEQLQENLRKEPAVHLDVTVGNNNKAVERMAEVFKDNGIRLVVDQGARASMKKNQPKAVYYIYAENVRPEELLAMLDKLGADETRGKTVQKSTFQNLVAAAMTGDDQQTLKRLLGVDLSQQGNKNLDPSLFEIKAIEGGAKVEEPKKNQKKKTDKASPTPSPSPGSERIALVLADNGDSRSGPSSEVRNFITNRRASQPGTVQVLLIVHQA